MRRVRRGIWKDESAFMMVWDVNEKKSLRRRGGQRHMAYRLIILLFIARFGVAAQDHSAVEERIRGFAADFGGRVGVAAKNLVTGEEIRVNGDSLFPTASVIKLPVLVELFYLLRQQPDLGGKPIRLLDSLKKPGSGILQYLHGGQSLNLIDVATLMIILSDNTATNYVIDQFGTQHDEKLEAVNSRMKGLGLAQVRDRGQLPGRHAEIARTDCAQGNYRFHDVRFYDRDHA
ncbi:MAG: serine hydrolase [Ignavibacteria bacterium]|nr:MAG: serine hydrolase [Ignavibacteria bacterium]